MTIRGVDDQLRCAIEVEAARDRTSLNRAVLALLRRATGLDRTDSPDRQEYDDLDDLAGTWSDDEADEFDRFLGDQRVIEERLWQPGT